MSCNLEKIIILKLRNACCDHESNGDAASSFATTSVTYQRTKVLSETKLLNIREKRVLHYQCCKFGVTLLLIHLTKSFAVSKYFDIFRKH